MTDRSPSRREFLAASGAVTTLGVTGWFGDDLAGRVTIADPSNSPIVATITERFRRAHSATSVSRTESDDADIRFANRPRPEAEAMSDRDRVPLGSVPDAVAFLHAGNGEWCRCLDDDQRTALLANASAVETWSEADPSSADAIKSIDQRTPRWERPSSRAASDATSTPSATAASATTRRTPRA